MTYTTETIEHSRKRVAVDLPRFAADFVAALGKIAKDVKLVKAEEYPNEHQAIMVGKDRLDLRSNTYALAGRVNCYITAPDVPHGDYSSYDKAQKTVDASVNPDGRSIEAIARDIKKRVIDANLAALAARRAYAATQANNRASIVKHAAELKAAVPALDIRVNEREQRAAIYSNGSMAGYLSGTLHADGTVSLDRVSSISPKAFRKIMAALAVKGE